VRHALAGLALAGAIATLPPLAFAQSAASDGPSESEIVKAIQAKELEIGPQKQQLVEGRLQLTDAELAKFRPIYAEYQQTLKRFNQRRIDNVVQYSRAWNAGNLTDAKAHELALEALAIQREEDFEQEMVYGKVRSVIPAKKAVLYLHIESKLRTLLRFKQAAAVPVQQEN